MPKPILFAQQEIKPSSGNDSAVKNDFLTFFRPEFLWSGDWESRHNLTDRFDLKLTIPKANLALRLEVLDRRPASSVDVFQESFDGETADKSITQPGLGLYHLGSDSRLLHGVLNSYGLGARTRNIWVRGAPYVQSREESGADLRTSPSSTAVSQSYAYLGNNGISLGPGIVRGFVSYMANDDPDNWFPAFNAALGYEAGKYEFLLEGIYTERTLPERKSSTWFNVKPALPVRDTRIFAGSVSFSFPSFGAASDLACSETFAFGRDYYSNLGLRFGNKPWRFSLALDSAGSRYVDSNGSNPGSGFRTAARLERLGKKTGLFRLTTVLRGPGPDQGLLTALNSGDFTAITQSFNRMSGEVYYRFPSNFDFFGLTRFSFSIDRDAREEKKVLDSGNAMAAFKLGPVNSVSEGAISLLNRDKSINNNGIEETGYQFNSYKLTQSLTWTLHGSITRKNKKNNSAAAEKSSQSEKPDQAKKSVQQAGLGERKKTGVEKKGSYAIVFSTRMGYEKTINKEGILSTSFSASLRSKKNRLTIKAATSTFPKKWEFTLGWRLQL